MKIKRLVLVLIALLQFSLASNVHANDVVQKMIDSTVVIETDSGQGSGVMISESGFIVTNLHVLEGAKDIRVKIANGASFEDVKIHNVDSDNDVVLLKVDAQRMSHVPIEPIATSRIGQTVFAVGAPKGFEQTVSKGIISSKRVFEGQDLIQTDAAISPGSSGGGLFSESGELLGVIVSFWGEGQNINFAVPIEYVNALFDNTTIMSEAEFVASDYINTAEIAGLSAKNPEDVLTTFLNKLIEDYHFEWEYNAEDDVYFGIFKSEYGVIFSLYEELILMQMPWLDKEFKLNVQQLTELSKSSIQADFCYFTYTDNRILVNAEIPVKGVNYKAFDKVVMGLVRGYLSLPEFDYLQTNVNVPAPVDDEWSQVLPEINMIEDTRGLRRFRLAKNLSMYYDASHYSLTEQQEEGVETSIQLDGKDRNTYAKITVEYLPGLLESFIDMDSGLKGLLDISTEQVANNPGVKNMEIISKGVRMVNGTYVPWVKYALTIQGIRFVYTTTALIIDERVISVFNWSLASKDTTSKTSQEALTGLVY